MLQMALRARGRPGQLGDLLSRSVTARGLHWVAGTLHDKELHQDAVDIAS